MSDGSLPSEKSPSPGMVRAESTMVKSEPTSPNTSLGGTSDDPGFLQGVRATPPVIQNGFHGSGSDSDSGVDAPLDFSLKSRNRISEGSEGDSSSDSFVKRLKKEPSDVNHIRNTNTSSPTNERNSNGGEKGSGVGIGVTNGDDKNGINHQDKIGEPPTALPGILPGAAGAAMPGMIPNAAMFASLPMYMDPRRLQQIQQQSQNAGGSSPGGKPSTRPFKAYPKDPLSLPLGFYGLPGMLPFPSIDTVSAQAMNMSSEEMFNQYRSYVMRIQQEQAKAAGSKGSGSKTPVLTQQQQQEQQRQFEQQLSHQLDMHKRQQQLLQAQQKESQQQQHQHQQPPQATSQQSPSGISETSTTARSMSSSPSSSCTTPIPTSPNGNEMAARPTGNGNGEAAIVANTSPGNGPVSGATTPSRKRGRILPDEQKDEQYWERRRKNNEAAKRSRDSRRAKEDEIAIRAAFLEQENLKLRVEVAALKNETAKLRCMLYNS